MIRLAKEEEFRLKYFAMVCRSLLKRQSLLQLATSNAKFHYSRCWNCFDEVFDRAFNFLDFSSNSPETEAVDSLLKELKIQAGRCLKHHPPVVRVFQEIEEELPSISVEWKLIYDMEQSHNQGRNLSRVLYSISPYQELRSRLLSKCRLFIDPLKKGDAPSAFKEPDELILRYHPSHSFRNYLVYPFLIYHEYTSHIYPFDNGHNDVFHEGWLLFVAESFLRERRNKALKERGKHGWILEQITMHRELHPLPEHDPALRGFNLADTIFGISPEHLYKITYELSSYQPKSGESETWPTDLINELDALQGNLGGTENNSLLDILDQAQSLREILPPLPLR